MSGYLTPLNNPGTWWQRLLILAVLAGTFFLSTGLVLYLALRGREVSVPNVVGKSQSEAEDLIESRGLRMKVRNRANHDKVAAGEVSEQSPKADSTVKTGQSVSVTISLGPNPGKAESPRAK